MSDLRKKLAKRDGKAQRNLKDGGKTFKPRDRITPSETRSENFRKKLKRRS